MNKFTINSGLHINSWANDYLGRSIPVSQFSKTNSFIPNDSFRDHAIDLLNHYSSEMFYKDSNDNAYNLSKLTSFLDRFLSPKKDTECNEYTRPDEISIMYVNFTKTLKLLNELVISAKIDSDYKYAPSPFLKKLKLHFFVSELEANGYTHKEALSKVFDIILEKKYNCLYNPLKNRYDKDVKLPEYSFTEFKKDMHQLLPVEYMKNSKGKRANKLYKELEHYNLSYVESTIQNGHCITLNTAIRQNENFDIYSSPDERTLKSYIEAMTQFTGVKNSIKTVPTTLCEELMFAEQAVFSSNQISYKSIIRCNAKEINKFRIINSIDDVVAIYDFTMLVKQICLVKCKSLSEYKKMIEGINEDIDIRAMCAAAKSYLGIE